MKKLLKYLVPELKTDEKGMASIIIVGFLIVLLTLISIGFTRIMNRSLQITSDDEQSSAASYAAQSGINAAATILEAESTPSPVTTCNGLFGSPPDKFNPTLDSHTQITCALVDVGGQTLQYNPVFAYKPKIAKIASTGPSISDITFSWESRTARNHNFINNTFLRLLNETAWNAGTGYAPLLRVTLYEVPTSGATNSISTHTFYLYPRTNGTNVINDVNSDQTNSLVGVLCNSSQDYDCSVTIKNLSSSYSYYYASVMPMYADARVQITADDGTNPISFKDGQVIIDVTAKSGSATKRLRARVSLNTADKTIPDFVLRTATTICKRLVLNTGVVTVDDPSGQCYNPVGTSLSVSLRANPTLITNPPQNSTLTWIVIGGDATTTCDSATPGGWTGKTTLLPPPAPDGSNNYWNSDVVNGIQNTTIYHITCHKGLASSTGTAKVKVNVSAAVDGLTGGGYAPTHIWLFAKLQPRGNHINSCFFKFDLTANSYGYQREINDNPNTSEGAPDGNTYKSICEGVEDNGTYLVTQETRTSGSNPPCDPGTGNSTIGHDNCPSFPPNREIQNGDIIHYIFSVTDSDGDTVNSPEACLLADHDYQGDDNPPYNKHFAYPCTAAEMHNKFDWYCDPPGGHNCTNWPP